MQHGNVSPQIAAGLLALKQRIRQAGIPSSKLDETLNLATWNIREFGSKPRCQAAIHYIAEIIGQFDLVAVVELRESLGDLQRVLQVLGPSWRAVYSGVVPDPGGNGERFAYVYDRRAVTFNGLAAMVLPARTRVGDEYRYPEDMWWRLPYMATFSAGNFDFILITVHIRWGRSREARRRELALLARWIEDFRHSTHAVDQDLIVLGDFNLPDHSGPLFQALTEFGLQVPQIMAGDGFGSNLARNKRYDQILQYPSAVYPDSFADRGGVLDFHISPQHIAELFPPADFPDLSFARYCLQMSDHLPVWIQIRTDNDCSLLEQQLQQREG